METGQPSGRGVVIADTLGGGERAYPLHCGAAVGERGQPARIVARGSSRGGGNHP